MEINERLIFAKNYIDAALKDLNEAPEKNDIAELLYLLKELDAYYKEWCTEHDEETGEDEGTTYEHGVSLEFYLEAEDMHDISLALRKLENGNG